MPAINQIVIQEGLVTKVTKESGQDWSGQSWEKTSLGKSVEVETWLAEIIKQRGAQTFSPSLTDGHIVAQKSQGAKEVIVVELKPAIRRIVENVDDGSEHARLIAMPWVYLVYTFDNKNVDQVKIFFSNEKISGLDAELCKPNLPNVHDSCKVCRGSVPGPTSSWTLDKKLDFLVAQYFDSVFNSDLIKEHWKPSKYLADHPQSFAEWEAKSKDDPKFILKIDWRKSGKTLQQILDEGVKE